jgi:hypothetical protein
MCRRSQRPSNFVSLNNNNIPSIIWREFIFCVPIDEHVFGAGMGIVYPAPVCQDDVWLRVTNPVTRSKKKV